MDIYLFLNVHMIILSQVLSKWNLDLSIISMYILIKFCILEGYFNAQV